MRRTKNQGPPRPLATGVLDTRLAGFEPATSCSGGTRSIQLSYRRNHRRENLTQLSSYLHPSAPG